MTNIRLQSVSKQFANTEIIRQLDLSVADGEFLTLVGPSGCGKSTLLRIIAGLETQSTGKISINGVSVENKRPSERDLAMVFQSYALYPHLSVFDNIAVPLRMRRLNSWQRLPLINRWLPSARKVEQQIKQQVEDVAHTLGLAHLLDRKPGNLSGGQRQRVAVGRAIVRKPKAFLFDEPLSNLDAKLRVHMRAEITRLHQQLQTTFIYVTHDQAEAMTMSDRIAVMMDGEIIQVGTSQEVYHNPQDIRVATFIGSPEINLVNLEQHSKGDLDFYGQKIRIPKLADANKSKSTISIGFRPESVLIFDQHNLLNKPYISLTVKVSLVENLGAELFVHLAIIDEKSAAHEALKTEQEKIIMRLALDASLRIIQGEHLNVAILLESLYLFDAKGKRIYDALMLQGQSDSGNCIAPLNAQPNHEALAIAGVANG